MTKTTLYLSTLTAAVIGLSGFAAWQHFELHVLKHPGVKHPTQTYLGELQRWGLVKPDERLVPAAPDYAGQALWGVQGLIDENKRLKADNGEHSVK
jgi:hypothetical protein